MDSGKNEYKPDAKCIGLVPEFFYCLKQGYDGISPAEMRFTGQFTFVVSSLTFSLN